MGNNTMRLPIFMNKSPEYWVEFGKGEEPKGARSYYERLGFTDIKEYDKYFYYATAPEGWTIEEEGYWCYVYDHNHLQRFSFFCKICLWEEDGFTRPNTRYGVARNWGLVDLNSPRRIVHHYVQDADYRPDGSKGTRLYETKKVTIKNEADNYDMSEEARLKRCEFYNKEEAAEKAQIKECEEWLDEHFPEWKDIYAYWD
jgi:hypothetical protein